MTRPLSPRLTAAHRPLRLPRVLTPSWWVALARYGRWCADQDYRRRGYTL